MDIAPAFESLKRQYAEAFNLLDEIMRKTDDAYWNSPGDDYFIPARQAYHAIQAVDSYTEPTQEGFNWGKFGIDWSSTLGEDLLNKEQFSEYLGEIRNKVNTTILYYQQNESEIRPDAGWQPWYPTVFDRLIYALRLVHQHLGMMSCELRKKGIKLDDPCW